MVEDSGRSVPDGLAGAEALEPHSGLHPSDGIPSAFEFRPDSKGNFDELIARFADGGIFFEDLGDNGLFVDIWWDDGRGIRLWAGNDRELTYNHECDSDGTEGGDAKAAPVPQDCQARAEGIAQNSSGDSHE